MKIPLNPPLQKGEEVGRPRLIENKGVCELNELTCIFVKSIKTAEKK